MFYIALILQVIHADKMHLTKQTKNQIYGWSKKTKTNEAGLNYENDLGYFLHPEEIFIEGSNVRSRS